MGKNTLNLKVRIKHSKEFEKVLKAFASEKKVSTEMLTRFVDYEIEGITQEEAFNLGQAFMENKIRKNIRDGNPPFNNR